MKKTFIILGAAALILFQACQKEEAANGTVGDKQEVSANIILNAAIEGAAEEGTKTTLGTENDIQYALWSKTDAVRTFDENGVYATMEIEADDDFVPSTTATFIAKEVPEGFISPLYSIYPESLDATYGKDTKLISFNLPAVQSYKDNSFADNTNVAVSKLTKGEDGKLKATFMNVCGYLKLQLKGDFKVGKIKLMGHDGEKLNGSFTVDVNDETLIATADGAPTDDEKVLTLDCGNDGVLLKSDQPTTFIFVVPVDAFAHGFAARIYDAEGVEHPFTLLTTTKSNNINRSRVKVMGEKQFTGTTPKFVEVEYIENTGKENISITGFIPDITSQFEIICSQAKGSDKYQSIWGAARTESGSNDYQQYYTFDTAASASPQIRLGAKNGSYYIGIKSIWNTSIAVKNIVSYDGTTLIVNGNNYTVTCTGTAIGPLNIFSSQSDSGQKQYGKGRIYKFKWWLNRTSTDPSKPFKAINMLPVKDNGAAKLLDLVSGTVYTDTAGKGGSLSAGGSIY